MKWRFRVVHKQFRKKAIDIKHDTKISIAEKTLSMYGCGREMKTETDRDGKEGDKLF